MPVVEADDSPTHPPSPAASSACGLVLATGSPAAQRTFLRAWSSRINADGMKLTVTLTLPGELGGGAANTGSFDGAQDFLPP